MRAAIWTFKKPTDTTVTPSIKVAKWLSKTAEIPIRYDENWRYKKPLDVLIIINGAFAFCKARDIVAEAILRAGRIIWVQNDYVIVPPMPWSVGQTPFRAAFRKRHEAGLSDMEWWSTCTASVSKFGGEYINWNAFFYDPLVPWMRREKYLRDVFYYGYYRDDREEAFNRYFHRPPYDVRISTPSHKDFAKWERVNVKITPPIIGDLRRELAIHGMGLYIEDNKSHREFHSPATRFYEMLGSGLPMAFEAGAVKMLRKAGFDVYDFSVESIKGLKRLLNNSETVRKMQHELWGGVDHAAKVKRQVKQLLKELLE